MHRICQTCVVLLLTAIGLSACQGPQSTKPEALIANIVAHDQSITASKPDQNQHADGFLSEHAAVMLALQHNPTFKAQLSELSLANADLQLAGQLTNPSLFYAFSAASKPYRYAIEFPLEALLLRPARIKQMQAQSKVTELQLMQTGFTLVRDTRSAYAHAVIAQEKVQRLEDAFRVHQAISRLVHTRETLGESSAQDTLLADNEKLLVARDLQSARVDAQIAYTQLMHQINQADQTYALSMSDSLVPACAAEDISKLQQVAIASRPDVMAAEAAVTAAKERQQVNSRNWLSPALIADATSGQSNGHVLAPAVRMNLPLFNQNQGQIARADAELTKALHQAEASKLKATLDIQTSHLKYQRDCQEWQQMQTALLPNAVQAIHDAEAAYQQGAIAYLNVLESTRRAHTLGQRESQLKADLVTSWSDLMRSTNTATPINPSSQKE